jgi:hypothetical protein
MQMPRALKAIALLLLVLLVAALFGAGAMQSGQQTSTRAPAATPTPMPSATVTPTLATTSQEAEHMPLQVGEPEGCRQPSDDYTRVSVEGHILNRRTLEMLEYAASLYNGEIDITGADITHGSYTASVAASGGTHAGGGAVDISVYDTSGETWRLREEEIPTLIGALRLAGFAAWYRPADSVEPGSAPHIHAIAIGDRELSPQAYNQVAGVCGYFSGYVGLPIQAAECQNTTNPPTDDFGGPVVCGWMCDLGYEVLQNTIYCKEYGGLETPD